METATSANDDSNGPLISNPVPGTAPDIDVGLPPHPSNTPHTIAMVAPENETEFERIQRLKLNTDDSPHSGVMTDDIAKILQEIKLPERRDFRGMSDVRTPPPMEQGVPTQKPLEKNTSTPTDSDERSIVTPLHTLKDDIQDIVRIKKMSMVQASALEADKKRTVVLKPPAPTTPNGGQRSKRLFSFVFFSVVFILLGSAALYGVYYVQNQTSAVVPSTPFTSIIFAETTVPIDISKKVGLRDALVRARDQSAGPLGSLTRIVPIQNTSGSSMGTPTTLAEFFDALGVHPPDELLRGLGEEFFLGIHTVDKNAPVLVIPVTSYAHAFAGMLAWEPTLNADLAPLFTLVPSLTTSANGLPVQRAFSDAIMLNYDIRVLKDDTGAVVLYYSFPTPNVLVIAESPHTFTEILSRLQAQRKL
jgi:hypothetical protein